MLVICVGIAWLLNTLNILPGVNWLWTGSLALLGIATLAVSGIDRFSVVVGPFFLLASIASVLRQTGKIHTDIEIPGLTISLGVLWLFAMVLPIRPPAWMLPPPHSKTPRSNG